MTSGSALFHTQDFSLVLGGPVYQLWRRSMLCGPALELLIRRVIGIPLFTWLPLLALTGASGTALPGTLAIPFLYDLEVHARLLVAIPLLLIAEVVIHQRMRTVVGHFVDSGIVGAEALPGFEAAIGRAMRLRNSVAVELALVFLAFGLGWWLWRGWSGLEQSTWFGVVEGGQARSTLAGWWYVHVSLPIFQFLLYRWYFRIFVWFTFLRQVSRLPLRLTPTHPDRAGGLGFLSLSAAAFAPLVLAQSVTLAAVLADKILYQGKLLFSFQYEIVAFVILQLVLILGPPSVFMGKLIALKRQARWDYGALATRYTSEFHEKWVERKAPPGEALLGSADIQSLADLANSYGVVSEIKPVPFGKETIVQIALATVIPLLPLLLTVVPAATIVKGLFGLLL